MQRNDALLGETWLKYSRSWNSGGDISHVRRFGGTNQRCRGYLHVDTREWFYVSAYLQYRLYCFGHEFVYFGHFDRRDVFG